MPPRLVLNALALHPGGSGVQTYIRELVRHLSALVDTHLAAVIQAPAACLLPPDVEPITRRPCVGIRRALEGLRPVGPADLVHGLDVDLPFRTSAPTVATVHDMAVFDVPWAFQRHRSAGERVLVARALAQADAIIAVSAFTAERVRATTGRDSVVIPEAPSPDLRPPTAAEVEQVRQRYQLPPKFVLHVGTVETRKNLGLLDEACWLADLPLVMAGTVREVPPPRGRVLGWVPTSNLPGLYGAATAVAYPSIYEGFGLPPLEAMACGAPVVASLIPPLREVIGNGAILVPPGDPELLASALRELADDDDRRRELARAGLAQASRFSWSATARATLAVYRRLGVDVAEREPGPSAVDGDQQIGPRYD